MTYRTIHYHNTPEALEFIRLAQQQGVPAAVAQRDAPFGDYSQAGRDGKPDPRNVVNLPGAQPGWSVRPVAAVRPRA